MPLAFFLGVFLFEGLGGGFWVGLCVVFFRPWRLWRLYFLVFCVFFWFLWMVLWLNKVFWFFVWCVLKWCFDVKVQ